MTEKSILKKDIHKLNVKRAKEWVDFHRYQITKNTNDLLYHREMYKLIKAHYTEKRKKEKMEWVT